MADFFGSTQPECDAAIEDIMNEAIVGGHDDTPVRLVLDEVKASDKVKEIMQEEFDNILAMYNFNSYGHDIFRRWYVDGRLPYHVIIDDKNPKNGIKELRYIDPTKLRKIKEVEEEKDPKTGANVIKKESEYFLFQDVAMGKSNQGIKIHADSVIYCTDEKD